MKINITFLPSNKTMCFEKQVTIKEAETIACLGLEYICGGNGTCGKCLVDIEKEGIKSTVKACQTLIEDGMIIYCDNPDISTKVLTDGVLEETFVNTNIDTNSNVNFGIAFDIGTTTIAAYLVDLKNCKIIYSIGELNEQVKYGGDVISRAIYAKKNGLEEISNCVRHQADGLIAKLVTKNQIDISKVNAVTVVGNTCMHHIFSGISTDSLLEIPYMPLIKEGFVRPAKDFFANVSKDATLYVLPVIAGFVGADTVAAMISTKFYNKKDYTLLLDIGTNGEMVLGNKDRYVTCSAASGPAFEGAKITCGMRGATGAIDHVKFDGEISYTTIDNATPKGICGSGIIDLISVLLDIGDLKENGRLQYEQINLTDDVFVSRKDIREVQLAKGAIAAGIEIMTKTLGIEYSDINEVIIAGAFGTHMDKSSICKIKMIPKELEEKIITVGNAAGMGAVLALISKEQQNKAEEVARKAEFIELASHANFQELFIKHLDF